MNGSATLIMFSAVCTRVGNALLLDRILHGKRIDDRGEHAHMVGRGAVHARALAAAPKVAAAQITSADLHPHIVDADQLVDYAGDDGFVQAEPCLARERFARKF